jgi:hypothetical protein
MAMVAACVLVTVLGGCNLEPWMKSCADCGEVRSITERPLRNEIGLITDGPRAQYISLKGLPPVPVVYDVRVHMDAGGSRDITLSSVGTLRVGDRVELRGAHIVPHTALSAKMLWL